MSNQPSGPVYFELVESEDHSLIFPFKLDAVVVNEETLLHYLAEASKATSKEEARRLIKEALGIKGTGNSDAVNLIADLLKNKGKKSKLLAFVKMAAGIAASSKFAIPIPVTGGG